MSREIIHAKNFAHEAADFILGQARAALAERGEFRIALWRKNYHFVMAGVHTVLLREPLKSVISLFGDERCVFA